jgi:hypothetical protein
MSFKNEVYTILDNVTNTLSVTNKLLSLLSEDEGDVRLTTPTSRGDDDSSRLTASRLTRNIMQTDIPPPPKKTSPASKKRPVEMYPETSYKKSRPNQPYEAILLRTRGRGTTHSNWTEKDIEIVGEFSSESEAEAAKSTLMKKYVPHTQKSADEWDEVSLVIREAPLFSET